jgi:hypothetical protein
MQSFEAIQQLEALAVPSKQFDDTHVDLVVEGLRIDLPYLRKDWIEYSEIEHLSRHSSGRPSPDPVEKACLSYSAGASQYDHFGLASVHRFGAFLVNRSDGVISACEQLPSYGMIGEGILW